MLLATSFAVAQTTIIHGKIYDAQTKEALVSVRVVAANNPTRGTITNRNGTFTFTSDKPIDSITVSTIGFASRTIAAVEGRELVISLTPSVASLQSVVVTASREAQLRTDAPIAISTVSPQMIDESKPKHIVELINKVPGVVMVNLGNEQHAMSIRQPFSYNSYFLYMEDGIPIRPAGIYNHNALIEMNVYALSSVEVVKGPASSLYGPEAVGGAINFITLRPTAVPTAKVGIQTDNYGYQRLQFNVGSFLTENFGISAGGFMSKQRNSWIAGSDYDKISMNLRADYFMSGATRLVGSFAYNDYSSQTGGSADSSGFYNREYKSQADFAYRKVKATRARLTLEHTWDNQNESFATLFYRNNDIGQLPSYAFKRVNNDPTLAHGEINDNTFQSVGFIAQHSAKFDFLHSKLIAGVTVDYSPNQYNAYYARIARDPVSGRYTAYQGRPDSLLTDYSSQLFNSALYAQYEITPLERLKITLGVRYDRIDFTFDNHLPPSAFTGAPDEKNGFNNITPKLGAIYDLGEGNGVYGNFSQGFCPPTLSQLYRGVKVPELKAAYFNNYELGGWATFFDNAMYVDVALYQMDGFNEIISYVLPDNSTENRNSGQTLHRGIEFSFTYKPTDEFFFRLGGTNALHQFVKYETKTSANFDGKLMVAAPDWISNAELTYRPNWLKGFRISAEWQYISTYYENEANTAEYNDKTLFGLKGASYMNIRAGYTFKGLEFFANAMNVTNELYATNVSRGNFGATFTPAAPRLFSFGVQYNFSGKE